MDQPSSPVTAAPVPTPFGVKLRRYARAAWNRTWDRVDRPLRALAARTSLGAQLYYLVSSSAFRRECHAVLAGRARYDAEHRAMRESYPLLRRNVHRIEKGLIMRPRRDVFAEGYIDETVAIYARLRRHEATLPGGGNPELTWAHDVLREYFNVISDGPGTEVARRAFEATEIGAPQRTPELIPFHRELASPPTVEFEDFLALCRRRRSVRWFESRPVPRDMLDQAVLAAAESPSACNRQPFTFRFYDDAALIARAARIPMGTAGFEHNFPVFGVIVGELSNYTDERDRHLIYIDGSLAAMSFCLAAETLGLSTCLINWPDLAERDRQMTQLLGLRSDQRVVMCLAAGFPDPEGLVPRSTKKPLDLMRSFNEMTR